MFTVIFLLAQALLFEAVVSRIESAVENAFRLMIATIVGDSLERN